MRKLASIQEVVQVQPIDNADAIEKVQILGWWIVAKKGDYQPGDRLVYCEIDSLLPERAEFEFLRASSFKPARPAAEGAEEIPAGFRIKTIKLRGQVSQGICFPLSILPPGTPSELGADVTEVLGVRKWEPALPVGMTGRVLGGFPGFLSKTDETRVQVLPDVLARHQGTEFYLTEKLDGTSFTAFVREGEFGLCSRNLLLDPSDVTSMMVQAATKYDLAAKMLALREQLGFDFAIQAELIGPGIQKNKYALQATELRVFNVYNIAQSRLIDLDENLRIVAALGLQAVPQLGRLTLTHDVDALVRLAEGTSTLNPNVQREGIVLRPFSEVQDSTLGGRLSFKAINPKFLLKYDE